MAELRLEAGRCTSRPPRDRLLLTPTTAAANRDPAETLVIQGSGDFTDREQEASWGKCIATLRKGRIKLACRSARELAVELQSVPGAPVTGKDKSVELEVSALPAVLAALGEVAVPPPEKEWDGSRSLAALSQSDTRIKLDPKATFTVETGDEITKGTIAPSEVTLREAIDSALLEELAHAPTPILFGGETAAPPPPRPMPSIIHVTSYLAFNTTTQKEYVGHLLYVFGTAKQIRDADWIAIETITQFDGNKVCGGYRVETGPDKGKVESLPLWIEQLSIVLRDRRTGTELGKADFEGPKRCPKGWDSTWVKRATSSVDEKAVHAWFKQQIAAAKPTK